MALSVKAEGGGSSFRVHVAPRASKSQIAGVHNDALKIRLAAPPVDGAANDELVKYLAKHFGVPRSAVAIISGHASRNKLVRIQGVAPGDVLAAAKA
ncbi:MAG: YggU family protein [Nitrospinae bacterium]|nr:YggU family protein [Nitrospinota bacterium]